MDWGLGYKSAPRLRLEMLRAVKDATIAKQTPHPFVERLSRIGGKRATNCHRDLMSIVWNGGVQADLVSRHVRPSVFKCIIEPHK